VKHERLSCLQRPGIEIRAALIKTQAIALYQRCAVQLRRALGPLGARLDDDQFKAAFATAVANRFAPYGPSHALTIPELRHARTMNCANYTAAVFWVYRNLGGSTKRARFMGFDHGPVLNHAQLWFGSLLADPTTGLVALAPLQDVLKGRPASIVVDISGRPEDPPGFREKVISALTHGLYRRQQVIYDRSPAQYFGRSDL
jgi:hypothetical protein